MKLNTPSKRSLLLGTLLGVWVYLFLVIIGPFDVAPLNIKWRMQIMLGYGVIFSISYFLADQLNAKILAKEKAWFFASFLLCFILLNFLPTYLYYKSELIQGEYSFSRFLLEIYLPTLLLLVPLMWLGKWILPKIAPKNSAKILFTGENKLDVLHLKSEDILYVQTAQNYVEFHYLENGKKCKKIMRATLKSVAEEIPELIKVHRSYLVNFDHFVAWKDRKTISVHDVHIPVSDTYKEEVLVRSKIHP